MLQPMTTESDAALMARFPKETWNQPLPVTNAKTGEVRYDCRLCIGLKPRYEWDSLPTDEAVMLAHIKERHGLEPVASVYVSPEEAEKNCKAVSLGALLQGLAGRLLARRGQNPFK